MIELNSSTGRMLRYGISVGIAVLLVGLIATAFSDDVGEKILWAGVAVVIFVPFVSIIISALALYTEKDWYWLKRVVLVVAISLVGLTISLLR